MNKRYSAILASVLLTCTLVSCTPGGNPVVTGGADTTGGTGDTSVIIHSIDELNTTGGTDTHTSGKGSVLELDYRTYKMLGATTIKTTKAYYPRLKRLADGRYFMTYQDGRWGPNIFYVTSTDLVKWSAPKVLFAAYELDGDTRNFATADILETKSGDIIIACCYRSANNYTTRNDLGGIAIKKSTDGGATFGDEKSIYTGISWEPSIIETTDGEIQVYFTHVAPYIALYGYNKTLRSSGSALLRSTDGGETFTPAVTESPYEAYRVMQSYIGDMNGRKMFNDQMPVALQLHNGSIVVACESEQIDAKTFKISLGYSADNWAHELAIDEAGPTDKLTNFVSGVAPYLAQFPSGETVLSCTANMLFTLRVGDDKAKTFGTAYTPFDGLSTGLWSSIYTDTSHSLVAASDFLAEPGNNESMSKLTIAKLHLNHTITAKNMTPVIDGDSTDWDDNTDALFVGSVSQAQVSVRAANDADSVSFLAERLDKYLNSYDDEVLLFVATDTTGNFYKFTLGTDGLRSVEYYDGTKFSDIDAAGCTSAAKVSGTLNNDEDTDDGYVAELKIPKSILSGIGDKLSVNIILKNTDSGVKSKNDTLTGCDQKNVSSWMSIDLVK